MPAARPTSQTFGDLLDEMAAARPQVDAVVHGGRRLTYAGLKDRVDRLARALLADGVRHGDRVAVLLPNRTEWIVASLAAAKLGAVTTAISTYSTPRELAWSLAHSGAGVLIATEAFRGNRYLDGLNRAELPDLRTVVSVDGGGPGGAVGLEAFLAHADTTGPAALAAAQRAVLPADICFILYTSGSTANPKGVTLAHGQVLANGFDIGERMHLGPDERVWLSVPLFWSFGSANAWPALMTHGGALVLQEAFEPGEALALIERERCTVYYGMANMARALMDHPDRAARDLSSMRTGLTIGVPEDIAMTIEATGAAELCNVYGSTETCGNCAVTDAHDPLPLRMTSQGEPLPGMRIRAVDPETRRPLPAGDVGELCVHGHVTPGYFGAPELDAAAFDAEGWFLTGDLGMVGDDGRVRFRGRLKELIKTGGINVSPLEVEQVLMQHPAVKQAYVVGVPDPARGEIVAAAVELHEGAEAGADSLAAFCRERLARYKVPALVDFRDAAAFPRTPTGKIHKPALRQELSRAPQSAGAG